MAVSAQKIEAQEITKYPVLKESVSGGHVVLFTREMTGVVVVSPNDPSYGAITLGDISHCWVSCTHADTWKDFDGEVILKNR